ncbi:MAG: DivIVA domain-containing protein [Oscillospiraceae bacterium]|jgi:cell division initiation protein|nr:DivIVA domain-containing protein [Oscillospiraceae bacterium]
MLTPQQIQETAFEKALFGGYDMDSVDDFLEPLTEDYVTLYKENSVLKSKMRILVEKLEEYRKSESTMQSALLATQKTCDQMVAEAEKKCAAMLHEAQASASAKTQDVDVLIGRERERLDAAKAVTAKFAAKAERILLQQFELIESLKEDLPEEPAPAADPAPKPAVKPIRIKDEQPVPRAYDFDAEASSTTAEKTNAIIEEIEQKIGESLGERPVMPVKDNTRRLESLDSLNAECLKRFEDLQFGKNYDPTKR